MTIMLGLAGFLLVVLGALVLRVNMMRSEEKQPEYTGKHSKPSTGSGPLGSGRR